MSLDPILEPIWQECQEMSRFAWRRLFFIGPVFLIAALALVPVMISIGSGTNAQLAAVVALIFFAIPAVLFVRTGSIEHKHFMRRAAEAGVDEATAGDWFANRHD